MSDPDFGGLVFMHISKFPERSYWECGWIFPKTGKVVWITLRGGKSGPIPQARQFYLSLPDRFEQILISCRPRLEQAFKDWERPQLVEDIFSVVELTGFGLEDPTEQPIRWDVGFETKGDDWLGITIPFVGDTAMEAVVDT
jgi:hypothetical protein